MRDSLISCGGHGLDGDVNRVDRNAALVTANWLEFHDAINLGVDGVILAYANVIADPELRTSLANNDCAREHILSIAALHAQPLGIAVTTVSGTPDAFFMSHFGAYLLTGDSGNRNLGQFLAMADFATISLLRLEFEDVDFLAALVSFNMGGDCSTIDNRCTNGGRADTTKE